MKKYIGIKIVQAEPCKAWKNSGPNNIGDDGYKVIYDDGYESWCPKKQFEKHNRELKVAGELSISVELMNSPDWKDRTKAEYIQLYHRAKNLRRMLDRYKSGELDFAPNCSYELLKTQLKIMEAYMAILEERDNIENIELAVPVK